MAQLRKPGSIRIAAFLAVPLLTVVAVTGTLPAQAARALPARSAAGLGWRIIRAIDVKDATLNDVVAFGDGTAWAGGATPAQTPVLYHLIGGKWHAVALPGPTGSFVSNVDASSSTNVWAALANEPDVAHLTAHGWVLRSFPTGTDDILIDGVVTTGPKNVWVFSYDFTTKLPHAYHYTGSSWTSTPLPALVDGNSDTQLVSASSPDNIWALAAKGSATLTMRYNGHKWQTFNLPPKIVPTGQTVFVRQILAESVSNVWATVYTAKGAAAGPIVLLHWNGHSWSKASGKAPTGALSGPIAPDGHGGVWLGAQSPSGAAFFLSYRNGIWTKDKSPVDAAGALTLSALTLIPGTRSLFGVGDAGLSFGGDNGAFIVKYGR